MTSYRLEGTRRFRQAAAQLRQAGRADLRREMTSGLKAAGRPILADQQEEVRKLKVTGSRFYQQGVKRVTDADGSQRYVQVRHQRRERGRGLRARVAGTLALEVKAGKTARIRFTAKGSKMPAGQETLPKHLDSGRGWRHPVFGNREMWVAQKGGSWFWPPIKRKIRVFRAEIDSAITRTVEKIEKS